LRFDIQPYLGAIPITFGMHRDEVHRVLGVPERSRPNWNKSGFSEFYLKKRYNVGYDNTWKVNHIGFGPGFVELLIASEPIWTLESQPDPNPIFLALDPEPFEHVGFWLYQRIGVTTTGYHDDDPSQYAISVFPRDRASLHVEAKPADTSRYRLGDIKGIVERGHH
jgi:hypothetical protein